MMTLLALTGGETALIVLAAFWGLLVLFLCVVLLNTFRVLESTKMTIDAMREETVPLLREVKGSVERTNRELDRVDTMLVTATDIVGRVEKLTGPGRAGRREPAREGDQLRGRAEEGLRARRRAAARSEAPASGSRSGSAPVRPARSSPRAGRRKQAQRVAPATIAREAKGGLMDLSKLVSESIQEGKQAMERARGRAAPRRARRRRARTRSSDWITTSRAA